MVQIRIAGFMETRQRESRSILQRMVAGRDGFLLQKHFKAWCDILRNSTENAKLDVAVNERTARFAFFVERRKESGRVVLQRLIDVLRIQLVDQVFLFWESNTRVQRMRRYGKDKNEKKKTQLKQVRGLFTEFAGEL